ncbi:MAG: glycosyltransferase family 2 protein [Anaerolineaceae bacterium]|jgi:glycosyltransferase involved in cell wall biosynthesis|nr:glycosyltransferase family 2 protein [Anaerolineaceae bacterium]
MKPLPSISIIIPSYNQAEFIETTILSVLEQGYPALEVIVIDGGSTDGTLDILRQYDDRLTWISELDRGQAHAINKGLALASGGVVAFLNSDDVYAPGALHAVGAYFAEHPQAQWLTGRCIVVNESGREIRKAITAYKHLWLAFRSYGVLKVLNYISQPATFWRRGLLDEVGNLNEDLRFTMDYEYWLRIGQRYRLHALRQRLAGFRLYAASKSGGGYEEQFTEELQVCRQFASSLVVQLHRLHNALILGVYRVQRR